MTTRRSGQKYPSKAYTARELISDLYKGIWSELLTGKTISSSRRSLQRAYIAQLGKVINPPAPGAAPSIPGMPPGAIMMSAGGNNFDLPLLLTIQLKSLRASINAALPKVGDQMTRDHLQDCLEKIKHILDPK